MTVDEQDRQAPSRSRSQAALEAYSNRLRPWRLAYAAAVLIVVIGVLVVVKIAYNHGEISHAKLMTAAKAAPSVALTGPSSTLSRAWTSTDHTAIGTPYWGGTLITYSARAVSGRDALTGVTRWSYTRDDRTACTAAQISGVTIAVFELNGNCDELTALDSATGKRLWTRTVDEDGQPLNGHPAYSIGQYTFMMTTPQVIYAISPDGTADQGSGGLNRWVFAQPGCTINSAVLGTAGALISQNCTHPACGDQKFCGTGQQLLLRDPMTGQNDDSSKNNGNPDQIKWNLIGSTLRPVSADSVISAVQPGSSTLSVLDAAKGKAVSTLTLKAPAGNTSAATPTASDELIRTGGYTYAVQQSGTRISWSASTSALPTVTATNGATTPQLSGALVAVAGADGIDLLDPSDGTVGRSFAVPPPGAGRLVYAFGTGFVVAGHTTTVYT